MLSYLSYRIQLQSAQVKGMQRRLEALSPQAVLARGYAIVSRKDDGMIVSRVSRAGDKMKVKVSDGEFDVEKISR